MAHNLNWKNLGTVNGAVTHEGVLNDDTNPAFIIKEVNGGFHVDRRFSRTSGTGTSVSTKTSLADVKTECLEILKNESVPTETYVSQLDGTDGTEYDTSTATVTNADV